MAFALPLIFLIVGPAQAAPFPPVDNYDGISLHACDVDTSSDAHFNGTPYEGSLRHRTELYNAPVAQCNFLIYFLYTDHPTSPTRPITLSRPLILENKPARRSNGQMSGTYIMGYGDAGEKLNITIDALRVTETPGQCAFMLEGGFSGKHQIKGLTLRVRSVAQAVCDDQGNDLLTLDSTNFPGKKGGDTGADFADLRLEVTPVSGGNPGPCQSDSDGDGLDDCMDFCDGATGTPENHGCPANKCVRLEDGQVFDRRTREPVDIDNDGVNDACDTSAFPDSDADGVPNSQDRCPGTNDASVMDPTDLDGDRIWDACDRDMDGDGILNADEAVRGTDIRVSDTDGDGYGDRMDACPLDPAYHQYRSQCGTPAPPPSGSGNFNDEDGDGVRDDIDNCPDRANTRQVDNDHDGMGNVCELDDDNDMVLDDEDNCPLTPNHDQKDDDGDGSGNACQGDADSDGVHDSHDNCLNIPNPDQKDGDDDGVGNACDINPAGAGLPPDGSLAPDNGQGGGGCSLTASRSASRNPGPLFFLALALIFGRTIRALRNHSTLTPSSRE